MKNKEDLLIKELIEEEMIEIFSKQQILKVQEENRKQYNLRRKKATRYKLGDLVAVKRTQFGSGLKLCKKFLGPYEITNVMPNERYEVVKVGNHDGPRKTSSCSEYMKPWIDNFSESESDH